MVFRPDFAVRLLAADPRAGFEAPIRIYLYENADGTATVSYLAPSAVCSARRTGIPRCRPSPPSSIRSSRPSSTEPSQQGNPYRFLNAGRRLRPLGWRSPTE